ncbi:Iron-sulfur cluster carrier protein [subsurface metagenome]
MNIRENEILKVLKTVIHPSAGKDIVSLGFIKNLSISEDKLSFDLSFSSVNDPLKSSIKRACEISLKEKYTDKLKVTIGILTSLQPVQPKTKEKLLPTVRNIVAVASGKGGVGKSTVATNLAIAFARSGANVGLIDADIFGPSIPKMLGVENEKPSVARIEGKDLLIPVEKYGIRILSIGFFVDPADATVWRGPMASNALKQLISDASWGELDYLFFNSDML